MRLNFPLTSLTFFVTLILACNKDNTPTDDCFPNSSTVRQITNQQAIIKLAGGRFYIVEQGAIDTKLNPCNLTKEFQVDNLQVTVSGDVKATAQGGNEPCCTENFVIAKISR